MNDSDWLNAALGFNVTDADRQALQRLREQAPSWLDWDWRTLTELIPRKALLDRPTAAAAWEPFRLD